MNQFYSGRGGPFAPREFEESVIQINRISKKTKGGNQIRFSALVVVGDKKGKVGAGLSKAPDVRSAIKKAIDSAKKNMIKVTLTGTTVPFSVFQKYSAAYVLIKPAPPGSGIIAGGPMRVVLELAGITDVVGKILGTKNKISNVYATITGLSKISSMQERRREN